MLASHGARAATRNASNLIPHTGTAGVGASRGIHIPSFVRVHPRIPNPAKAQKLFTQSRNLLAQFFNHLTAPGLRAPTAPSISRSFHGAARVHTTIQQGFSLPARVALSRPLQPHFLPRAPAAVPRAMTQVGLGTARNFSTGRPIFQNLIENVPVAGRAFYEADWDLKMRQEREKMRKPLKAKSSKKHTGKEMLKPRARDFVTKENKDVSEESEVEAQLDQYFPAPAAPEVTTCLLIPLAPTPTARVPLSENPSSHSALLPLRDLASIHMSHETHSLRVSSLFSRLDASNVWERGVQCSAFSHGGGADGVCTMLKVEFIGWTKAEVRSVIGESGTGWCVLEEAKTSRENAPRLFDDGDDEDVFSDTSSILSGMFEDSSRPSRVDLTSPAEAVDPSHSLLLPTLDFSSTFLSSSFPAPTPQPPAANLSSFVQSSADFDPWLDSDAWSDGGLSATDSWIEPPSDNGWFGHSSESARRAEIQVGYVQPRATLFL
ncbi:hypothetical protein Hypma_008649 [Hypsizygus marmoreus]|uniref:Uncharacterized protein n=1 Tax=Hypsizygus marmoreus TaxID=39966 RepID=A0A369JWJ1_HYPMA|nr:hypothetical protein Hypma_008649 [Hypsizygus marmoreus]